MTTIDQIRLPAVGDILEPRQLSRRRNNLILSFLGQNLAVGITYGCYGTLLRSIENEFSTSRTVASSGISMLLLGLGIISPVAGGLLQVISIRLAMMAGALVSGLAYLVLSVAPSMTFVLAGYLAIGMGTSLLGIVAPTTLISRWYAEGRGRALGIVNLPILLLAAPIACTFLLPQIGMRGIWGAIAAVHLALIPVLLLVTDRPDPRPGAVAEATGGSERLPLRPIFTDARFWLLTMGIGILGSAGTIFVVHFVSLATQRGLSLQQAATILTGFGVFGIAGTFVFGWITDKIAPPTVLLFSALLSAALWAMLLVFHTFAPLLVVACLIGACSTGLVALQGAVVSNLFGVSYVSTVIGMLYFFKLPFIFGGPPAVGYLFDATRSYTPGILLVLGGFLAAAIALSILLLLGSRRQAPQF